MTEGRVRPPLDYLRDPRAIYRLSAARVAAETDVSDLPRDLVDTAYRLVHACAMPEIVSALRWGGSPVESARRALQEGASILVDCEMLADGINRPRLPAGNAVVCTLNDPRSTSIQSARGTTRSAAAIELWREQLAGSVVAVGNAPTALFRLLEGLIEEEWPSPAAIFAFPVGFVGAAESKSALVESGLAVPYLTLEGRRGGSALAAAAVNSLSAALDE